MAGRLCGVASDPLKPVLTVHTGKGIPGRITLPMLAGRPPDERTGTSPPR
jgi:hypothetical protein